MLRDSKLNFRRLSPVARTAVIGSVLFGGLLVAGLRGPTWQTQAHAEEPADATAGQSAAPAADAASGEIDLSVVPYATSMFAAFRPADVLAHPALAPLAKLWFEKANVTPMGKRVPGLRQITMVVPMPAGPRDVIVYQSFKPLAAATLFAEDGTRFTTEDLDGRKILHVGKTEFDLQYNDRTILQARSSVSLRDYLASDRGSRPSWLPKKTWESFRQDHAVCAMDARAMRPLLRMTTEQSPVPMLSTLAPLWEKPMSVVAGLRLDADIVRIHAVAITENEEDAQSVCQTVDAIRVLAMNAFQQAVKQDTAPAAEREPFSPAARALQGLRVTREGSIVRAEASISLDAVSHLGPSLATARQASARAQSLNNLKQLALALLNYEAVHGHFPPAVVMGPDGKMPHSWRVEILPYLECQKLYDQYRLDEPWDSPANHKILVQMPDVFRSPTEPASSTGACYFVLTGPGTMFDGKKGTRIRDVRDGTAFTILLVEAKRDIPWTKPEDIPYDADKPLPKLGGFFEGKFNLALADGSVHLLSEDVPQKTLRALVTKDGREVVRIEDALQPSRSQPPSNHGFGTEPKRAFRR